LVTPLPAATTLTQHGITWTFDRDARSGTFLNGDHWVVGPVTVIHISPFDPDPEDEVDLHGAVVNPRPVLKSPYTQSFDSRIEGGTTYRRELNVARRLPLRLEPGSSLVSVRSRSERGEDRLLLADAAVLTVLAKAPPAGSFRPPYAGTDKSIPGTVDQLDLTIFRSLPRVAHAPALSTWEGKFNQVLIDVICQWPNTTLKTGNGGPAYGRDIAREVGDAVLSLNLNYPDGEKLPVVVKLVQRGIDTFGLARAGMVWMPNGGHNNGRKLPLLIAARALQRPDMLGYADARRHLIFQEDMQHWFVTESDVRAPRLGAQSSPFTSEMVGLAEWASNPIQERQKTGSEWPKAYRHVNGSVNTGMVLAAELMGLRPLWNWDPLFTYTSERYWPTEGTTPTNSLVIPAFHRAMWNAYRDPKAATIMPRLAAEPNPDDRLVNLSARGRIGAGGELIAGFVLQGRQPRPILIRGIGPALKAFGLTDALADTQLTLHRHGQQVAENEDHSGDPAIASAASRVGAFALSSSSPDAALLMTLEPGNYSVHVTGGAKMSGVALVEVYDAGEASSTGSLINLSARGHVGRGQDIMIAGIAVAGQSPKRLLIRALGPALRPYGVPNTLSDPQLTLMHGDRIVGSNDDWGGAADIAAAAATIGAFPVPAGSKDSALLLTLPPGNYTAQVTGRGGATGAAMIEVYDIP
jgi:hypothetical protein